MIMDALSHYRLGQEYAAQAGQLLEHIERRHFADTMGTVAEATALAELAQAHTALALTGVTALGIPNGELPFADGGAWFKTASMEGRIPPETDDEDPAEQDDSGLREGSMSPAADAGLDALASWLRRVPLGTILEDVEGDRWYRVQGALPAEDGTLTRFPAILCASTSEVDNLDDADSVRHANVFAPFTVFAPGDGAR